VQDDGHTAQATVVVTDDGAGRLSASVSVENASFTNVYADEGSPMEVLRTVSSELWSTPSQGLPQTGDSSSSAPMFMLLAALAAVGIGVKLRQS
jgi:LPXTG-motif cell wall-anchored protein